MMKDSMCTDSVLHNTEKKYLNADLRKSLPVRQAGNADKRRFNPRTSACPARKFIQAGGIPPAIYIDWRDNPRESALKERLLKYKKFAIAFSYPEAEFFDFFPQLNLQSKDLALEYDRLFRGSEAWLYGCEYTAENEFQRAQGLSDINGFYRAFGLETNKERPDSLFCFLEFMHYLIFKELNAPSKGKAFICLDAQKKFFSEHLYPQAKKIIEKVISGAQNEFYLEASRGLDEFLEEENKFFKV